MGIKEGCPAPKTSDGCCSHVHFSRFQRAKNLRVRPLATYQIAGLSDGWNLEIQHPPTLIVQWATTATVGVVMKGAFMHGSGTQSLD